MPNNSCANSDPDVRALNSAIERFARKHEQGFIPADQKKYEELIPASAPDATQQYAFEVDLDKCTGCKACVTACHNENGLDADETWRSVGLLQGGTSEQPAMQHITTACHHCAEPGCMKGCPTLAYKKDEVTGIVKHLDDQCFGCQYCILKCPYDVPKYSKKRGIVHKCDMCIGRLTDGQAPACVRACPTGAIRITLVDRVDVRQSPRDYVNIPDAPASDYTFPTTKYTSSKPLAGNLQAADYFVTRPEHAHLPLVFMLVMTQLSVGGFGLELFIRQLMGLSMANALSQTMIVISLAIGLLALAASILHLGRPHLFFRAILGVRTSWLSREIIAFALYAKLAIVYALCFVNSTALELVSATGIDIGRGLGAVVIGCGLIGIFCSVKVYQDTRRPFWDTPMTLIKFFMTAVTLGTAVAVAVYGYLNNTSGLPSALDPAVPVYLCWGLVTASIFKLSCEASIFMRHDPAQMSYTEKTVKLMTHQLKPFTRARFILGGIGGVLIPLVIIALGSVMHAGWLSVLGLAALLICFVAELAERYLFFTAVVPLKMPGGITID